MDTGKLLHINLVLLGDIVYQADMIGYSEDGLVKDIYLCHKEISTHLLRYPCNRVHIDTIGSEDGKGHSSLRLGSVCTFVQVTLETEHLPGDHTP